MKLNKYWLSYLVQPLDRWRSQPETPDAITQAISAVSQTFYATPTQKGTEESMNGCRRQPGFLNDVRDTDLVSRALETLLYLKSTAQNRALRALQF
jgi:hypothetical protein